MSTLKDMIRLAVDKAIADALDEMMGTGNAPNVKREQTAVPHERNLPVRVKDKRQGGFPKGPRVMYHVGRRMGQRELAEMRPNDRKAYDYVVKHAPCSAAQVEQGTGLGRKATESALWSLRKGNNAGAIKSKPIA